MDEYVDVVVGGPVAAEAGVGAVGTVGTVGTVDSVAADTQVEGVYETEEEDEEYKMLLDAQEQWEQSLQQLNQVLNWIMLPLLGKFLGRKLAWRIWRGAMAAWWS